MFALTILVTGLQNIDDVGEFKIRIGEQNEEVVNQIGRFILQLFLIVHRGSKCGFYASSSPTFCAMRLVPAA